MREAKAWVRKSHRTKHLHPSKQKWEVIWEDPEHDRKPYTERTKGGFTSKAAAEEWAKDHRERTRSGAYTDPTRAEVTFRTLAEEWLAAQHFDRRHTANGYRRIIEGNNDLMDTFGDTPIGEITYAAVLRYIKDASSRLAAQTVRHRFYVLRTVLDYAVHNRHLPTNVARSVPPRTLPSVKRMKAHEEKRYPLTLTETERIIAAMPYPHDVFTRLVADSWMRPEEATGLRLRDVDLDDGFVRVRTVIVEVQGELFREEATKTAHSSRDIDLSTPTLDALEAYIRDHKRRAARFFTEHPEHEHPGEDLPLFVGSSVGGAHGRPLIDRLDYSKPLRYSSLDRYWKRALKEADVPHMRFYELRHAGISRHVARIGQDGALTLKEIQERAGHGSATMTLDRYARSSRRDGDKRRAALDAAAVVETATNVTPLARRRRAQ
ncbi:tyrosine-type recombinase/integrase [Nocardioides sp. TF02-7]|uniref:tyrosine-type recombinase/integrase n=1 Tax=Nocardioides sp. TF02-7 TaxID=2917724 RepID=UPI001F05ABE3|nr:tyrosine-type recombinase/integrase [Nocardioides sp. TF02-7]UMG92834.1 tyrosine-type recombinase/integrase [Nocardioides sp. TF02-7]